MGTTDFYKIYECGVLKTFVWTEKEAKELTYNQAIGRYEECSFEKHLPQIEDFAQFHDLKRDVEKAFYKNKSINEIMSKAFYDVYKAGMEKTRYDSDFWIDIMEEKFESK